MFGEHQISKSDGVDYDDDGAVAVTVVVKCTAGHDSCGVATLVSSLLLLMSLVVVDAGDNVVVVVVVVVVDSEFSVPLLDWHHRWYDFVEAYRVESMLMAQRQLRDQADLLLLRHCLHSTLFLPCLLLYHTCNVHFEIFCNYCVVGYGVVVLVYDDFGMKIYIV